MPSKLSPSQCLSGFPSGRAIDISGAMAQNDKTNASDD